MIRVVLLLGMFSMGTACVHTPDLSEDDLEYRRIEYFESVFRPAAQACARAGGFLVFDGLSDAHAGPVGPSYSDMRLAMAKGCAGI